MKKKKTIVTAIVAIIFTLIGVIIFCAYNHITENRYEKYYSEMIQKQENEKLNSGDAITDEIPSIDSEDESKIPVLPPIIVEKPDVPIDTDNLDIDVGTMTKNPEPEVLDVEIQQETKERDDIDE